MTPQTTYYVFDLIQSDIRQWQDNLYRARAAAKTYDPSLQWGQSGRTLQQIIDSYQERINKATTALSDLEASASCRPPAQTGHFNY